MKTDDSMRSSFKEFCNKQFPMDRIGKIVDYAKAFPLSWAGFQAGLEANKRKYAARLRKARDRGA